MAAEPEAAQRGLRRLRARPDAALDADYVGMIVEGHAPGRAFASTRSPYSCTTANSRGAESATARRQFELGGAVNIEIQVRARLARQEEILGQVVGVDGWFKATASEDNGTGCVEVNFSAGGLVGLRDSKQPHAAAFVFTPGEWRTFLDRATRGRFH